MPATSVVRPDYKKIRKLLGAVQYQADQEKPVIGEDLLKSLVKEIKALRKEDLNALVAQLQEQAGEGEIDASLIDDISEAVDVALGQNGETHTKPEEKPTPAAAAPSAPMPEATPAPSAPENPKEAQFGKMFSSRPPDVYVPGAYEDEMMRVMPQFEKALVANDLRKANEITGGSQGAFDEAHNRLLHLTLDRMGLHSVNAKALHSGAGMVDTSDPVALKKAITSGQLAGINLIPLVRLMTPVYAGMVRRIPINNPQSASTKATWRAYLGLQNFVSSFRIGISDESETGTAMSETPVEFSAYYRDITVHDSVTLKSTFTGKGYDDPMQVSVLMSLAGMLKNQEQALVGNNAAAIGTPAKPVAVGSGSGTIGSSTSRFVVTALTYEGVMTSAKGVAVSGAVYGETVGSTISDNVALDSSAAVTVTWAGVPGAQGYNLYYTSNASTLHYAGSYSINKAVVTTTMPSTGNTAPTVDGTVNAVGYEGLMAWAEKATVYGIPIHDKIVQVDQAGAGLTAKNSGIVEIDSVLSAMFKRWKTSPTAMLMSPDMSGYFTEKLMSINDGSMYRVEVSAERGNIQGGVWVSGYVNRFAPLAPGMPRFIDVIPHPEIPDGKITFLSEMVPYANSREARGFAREQLIPYMYFPLASTSLSYPYALTLSETLLCFHPSPQTSIAGIGMV